MKVAIVLLFAVSSVLCASVPASRSSGWSTPGWTTPPPTTQGWAQPSSGWGSGSIGLIDLNAGLTASGSGWAAENHQENAQAIGGGGWGGPAASIVISASGQSLVDQAGGILQVTSQDDESAASINNAVVSQTAEADEAELIDALGLEVSNSQSGWAGANGEGTAAAAATSLLNVQQLAENLGLSRP